MLVPLEKTVGITPDKLFGIKYKKLKLKYVLNLKLSPVADIDFSAKNIGIKKKADIAPTNKDANKNNKHFFKYNLSLNLLVKIRYMKK